MQRTRLSLAWYSRAPEALSGRGAPSGGGAYEGLAIRTKWMPELDKAKHSRSGDCKANGSESVAGERVSAIGTTSGCVKPGV